MTVLPSLAIALALLGADAPAGTIEDPSGVALDGFFSALARTEAATPGAMTRVMHLGDSSIGLDGLPHALRKRMQDRFGDGGAGFVYLDRESANYEHRAALLTASGWDICYVAYHCEPSGRYGYAGHVFRGRDGAKSRVRTRKSGKWGRSVSKMELWYQADPKGGALHVRVDAEPWSTIETRADVAEARWHTIDLEPGAHAIDVKHGGRGRPRAYGVVLETDGPGVVWDTLSMIGAFTKRLMYFDAAHLRLQIDHRAPDLLVFGFGGNDLRRFVTTSVTREEFVAEMRDVLAHVRGPERKLSCLVVGVVDHARAGRYDVAKRHVVTMVAAQREAALAEGCAFFDAVAAMGGPGSIKAWRRMSPPMAEPDLQHLSMHGRDRLGGMIFDAMMARYAEFDRPDAG